MTAFFAEVGDKAKDSQQKQAEESKGIAGQISKDVEFGRGVSCPDVVKKGVNFFNSSSGAINSQVGGNHYRYLSSQPFEFIRQNNVPHAEGEIIYHIIRHRTRHGRRDLEKAIHWIQLIIESEYSDAKDCEPCPPQSPPVSSSSVH